MTYHVNTTFEAELEHPSVRGRDKAHEVIKELTDQILDGTFSEADFEFEVGDDETEIKFRLWSTLSYKKGRHHELVRETINHIYELFDGDVEFQFNTWLTEVPDEEED